VKDLSLALKGAGISLFGFVASKFFAYFYSIITARTLGPENLGILVIAANILGFIMMFANLGLPSGVTRFIPFYREKGDEPRVKGVLIGSIAITLASATVFAVIMFLLSDFIGIGIYNEPKISLVIKYYAAAVPIGTLLSTIMLAILGFKQVKHFVFVRNILETASKLFFVLILFALGFRLFGVVFAFLLSYSLALLVAFYLLEKKVYPFVKTKIKPKFELEELFKFSIPLLAATFFSLLLTTLDSFMLGYFVNSAAVGIYSVAETLARLQLIAYNSISILFVPIVTGYFVANKMGEMSFFFKAITRWIFVVSLPMLLFLILFSQQMLSVLYGAEYVSGFMSLAILSIGFFLVVAVGPTQSMLRAVGKTKYDLINTVVAAIVNIGLNWFLIPLFESIGAGQGIVGAAIATAISLAVWNILTLVEVLVLVKIHPYNSSFFKPIIASFATAAVTVYLMGLVYFNSFLQLLVASGLFMAVYLTLLVLMKGVMEEDVEMMRLAESRFGLKKPVLSKMLQRFL